jgi:hypothetical protein
MLILLPCLAPIDGLSLCDALPLSGEIQDLEAKYRFFEPQPELDDSHEVIFLALGE